MESGKISSLTATESHTEITSPEYARLNSQTGGGAWCHPSIHPNNFDQFYQIELPDIAEIGSIGLQGRHRGLEGVEKARINVSLTGDDWFDAGIIGGSNKDNSEMVIIHEIDPIHAKFVRFIPISSVITPVCVRLELYGQGFRYDFHDLWAKNIEIIHFSKPLKDVTEKIHFQVMNFLVCHQEELKKEASLWITRALDVLLMGILIST